MNLQKYIGRTVKLYVTINGADLNYTATIKESDDEQTIFTDKFGKEIMISGGAINSVEALE